MRREEGREENKLMQQRARVLKNNLLNAHLILGRKIWVHPGPPVMIDAFDIDNRWIKERPRIYACYFKNNLEDRRGCSTRRVVFRIEVLEFLSGEDDFREDQEDEDIDSFLASPRDEDEIRWLDDYLRELRKRKEKKEKRECLTDPQS